MADTESPASSPITDRAADQARIRKERREAKIKAGASARLNKISGLGGGVQRDAPPKPTVTSAEDPEEVDISVSDHFYQPNSTPRQRMNMNMNTNIPMQQGPQMTDEQLRQMMLGFPPPTNSNTGTAPPNPFAGFPGMDMLGGGGAGMPNMDDDPMMKIMQQFLGAANGNGAGVDGRPNFPPGAGSTPLFSSSPTAPTDPYAYIWRIVHAIFALSLGLYIAFSTAFTGTKLEREQSALPYDSNISEKAHQLGSVQFFWIFATAEVVLQSSRFFFDKGIVQYGGWLGTVVGMVPEPWKGYLAVASRYARIWGTLRNDAMTLVFVLGVCAWWRGL